MLLVKPVTSFFLLQEICESQDAEAAQILQMHFNSTVAAKINGDDSSLCAQLEE